MKSNSVHLSNASRRGLAAAALALLAPSALLAQATRPAPVRPDLDHQKTLYVVGYAHLDTQWRWSYPQTIREYIKNTLLENFANLDRYPGAVFNFTGARRYQFMKEYYPAEYERLKKYVADGRWFPCGASVDESDCNLPGGESLIRHVLYGNRFFKQEFGVESQEVMRPDSFGFTAALPSILAHCGIRGYSTQKLTWGSAVGIPFNVGVWNGPDGHGVIAAFNPGSYGGVVTTDLSHSEGWATRLEKDKATSGISTDYFYYGTGDRGGAPVLNSLRWVDQSVRGDGPVKVISGPADQMFRDISDAQRAKLPTYSGDLLLTGHSTGALTSQAFMKRSNRKNEQLADGAERAAVTALWLGTQAYPTKELWDAWMLLLGSQMHDILPGTCLPAAYAYAWNDEFVVANALSAVEQSAVGAVAGAMDTRGEGVSLVVYNPVASDREAVVEANLIFAEAAPNGVAVYGPDGAAVPAQVVSRDGNKAKVLFVAKAPSVGFATYDVRPATMTSGISPLNVSEQGLENQRYKVTLNSEGDVASVVDKASGNKELLSGPARLEIRSEHPVQWPSWNMDWPDRQGPARAFVSGPALIRVVENGPARVALEVTRQSCGSTVVQNIRLSAAQDATVEFDTHVNWQTREASLRQTFPLTVSNPRATYDLQAGTITRPNNDEKKYEVPQHQWLDLTNTDNAYGVTVLNDCKYGSDKPGDSEVRLTLLYTPGVRKDYQDQGTQDLGKHDMLYALSGHTGPVGASTAMWDGIHLNQPMRAFIVEKHPGSAKSISLFKVSDPHVAITAIKKAEEGDGVVVRLRELSGKQANGVKITAAGRVVAAQEINGQEYAIAPAKVEGGALIADLGAYELRAFEVKLAPPTFPPTPQPTAPLQMAKSTPVDLPFDTVVATKRGTNGAARMNDGGEGYPAELLPATLTHAGVTYHLSAGSNNAVAAAGQQITLPTETGAARTKRVHVLAASSAGDVDAAFDVDGTTTRIRVQDWSGFIGQWDTRLWGGTVPELAYAWTNPLIGLAPGYVKPAPIAWHSTLRRSPAGADLYYQYGYLFAYELAVPTGGIGRTLTLPNDPRVKVLAASVTTNGPAAATPAAPLFDTLADHTVDAPRISVNSGELKDATAVDIAPPTYWGSGTVRYTSDGSEVTAASPVVSGSVLVSTDLTLRARHFGVDGAPGAESVAKLTVHDVTAPTAARHAIAAINMVRVDFSEPLDQASATDISRYSISNSDSGKPKVIAATLAGNGMSVLLELSHAAQAGQTITISGVADSSPAKNTMQTATAVVEVKPAVFHLAAFQADGNTGLEAMPRDLPVKSADHWTMNLLFRPKGNLDDRTIIAGFGNMEDVEGEGRYFAKFAPGLNFWVSDTDVATRTRLVRDQWQMLTATYDGISLRTFHNGALAGERVCKLKDDGGAVRVAPVDPWEKERRFVGEVREMNIWTEAFPAGTVKMLWTVERAKIGEEK